MTSVVGKIVRVIREPAGSVLTTAVTPGDLALSVDWSIDFTPGERRLLLIGGEDQNETLAYTAVDDAAEVLTIEAPGAVLAWDEGDPVVPLSPDGRPEETWQIDVDMGDGGDPLPCRPSQGLKGELREDAEYFGVRCEVVGGEVVRLLDKPISYRPEATQLPLFAGHLAVDQFIPDGSSYTRVEDWIVDDLRGGMQYDYTFHEVIVTVPGYYSIAGQSAVMWESDPTGRRAIRPTYSNTGFGVITGGENVQDASSGNRHTSVVASPIKVMPADCRVAIEVSQTSGSSLELIGESTGVKSFLGVKYEGPWEPV